ncbi:MAG: hypothetical protein JOS17DRAFT_769522 [Linnemannia elongata]|nr:MAG: hypothetical protein JOS17DRAFT_769522 [Linnemannia elongata]
MPQQQHHPFHAVTSATTFLRRPQQQQHQQQPLQQLQHEQQQYNSSQTLISPSIGLQARLPQDHAGQQRVQRAAAPKQRPASHYGARYNPMATASSSVSSIAHSHIPTLPNIQLGESPTGAQTSNYVSSAQSSSPGTGPNQLFSSNLTMDSDLHPLSGSSGISIDGASRSMPIHQASPPPRSNPLMVPSWPPSHISGYQSYEQQQPQQQYSHGSGLMTQGRPTNTDHPGLAPAANFYSRPQHTPLYQMGIPFSDGSQFNYGSSPALSPTPLLGLATAGSVGSDFKLPAFDVKAYTFRKKSRHYVAVKQGNALRIEPIIYLKTSILDHQQDVVRNWDYLRFSPHRFRDNALPKKKLTAEEMRSARILDVDISLISPNNKNRLIEDSCPACVMRMDGERKIMQVLAKNFKVTHTGEPVIDIRKGHAIVCIKLNCYSDHHNEQEGFVVRMQTLSSIVDMGSSVKLRICCEARSKAGTTEVEVEEEDGLTDIDAPASLGSRSPLGQERPAQSPSLSYGSESPGPKVRARQRSVNSSSVASPRSVDERTINSLAVESNLSARNGGSTSSASVSSTMAVRPPAFRKIYPLTPSEGSCLGGTRVTIHGANFDLLRNPVVYFGKARADLVIVSHHDVMECTTPPAEGLKPGIVNVQIASEAELLSPEADSVEFMYTVPPDYDLYNLAATSLSYAMANEYPLDDSLAFILRAHRSGAGLDPLQGWGVDQWTGSTGSSLDLGISWTAKEELVLDFLRVIQVLAPGRTLPAFTTETGHSLLHIAVQYNMVRLAKELVAMGIDHTAVDRNQMPALDFAEMLSSTEMVQVLSSAKVPPRPKVPPLFATATTRSSMKEMVASLIQKHEATLINVLEQEQERKHKELMRLRDRSLRIMELKDQALGKESIDEEAEDGQSSPSLSSLGEGSPERDLLTDEQGRKRKSHIDTAIGWTLAKKLNIEASPPLSALDVLSVVDSGRMSFIKNGCQLWESSRGAQLFGDLVSFGQPAGLQIWACDSVTLISLDPTTGTYPAPKVSKNSSLAVVALSTTGLHLFKEDFVGQDRINKSLENWSLMEIERIGLLEDDLEEMTIGVDMCCLVPRGGRNLLGERIEIKSTAANNIVKAISEAQTRLNQHQRVATRHCWAESQLKLWSTLFGVEAREFDAVLTDHLDFEDGVLTMKPIGDNRRGGHSVPMIGAVLASICSLDNCKSIDFSGVKAEDDGWNKPELVRQLERTVQAKRGVVIGWNFSRCGWAPSTIYGFLKGFNSTKATMEETLTRCAHIILAGNHLNGDDSVGHALVESIGQMAGLETLDVTDCDIGLVGMDTLVHHIKGLVNLRVRGNRCDQRWWTWTDTLLQRNPKLRSCHIGAPIKVDNPSASLLSLERLQSLDQLVELDLTDSWINTGTLDTLARYLRIDASHHLKTLTLSHCQLDWCSSLARLFRTICDVNTSTKFTLNVGRNPLFDKEESVRAWIESVEGAKVSIPFGIQMTELVVADCTLQQILGPLAAATCFNELNFKGLYVKQNSLSFLSSYDEMRLQTVPVAASPESCLALGEILESNSTLVMLDISGTTAPSEGAGRSVGGFGRHVSLAFPGLGRNSTLRILALDHNRFGEEGLSEFCQALRSNSTLGVLTCDGNDIFTPQGLCSIERIFSPASPLYLLPSLTSGEGGCQSAEMMDMDTSLANTSEQQYNRTLCVWTHGQDEILMHVQLLTQDVTRLEEERDRLEKLLARSRDLTRESEVKVLSEALEELKRRVAVAKRARFEYSETHARIVKAISDNNERVKHAL